MTQTTTGWRAAFSVPTVYRWAQRQIGSPESRRRLVDQYLPHDSGDRILDIGCGTGDLSQFFDDCKYVGYDMSEAYIASACERYGDAGEFHVGRVGQGGTGDGEFDLAVAKGVLHHLDDDQAQDLFAEAWAALSPNGALVTIDPCFVPEQSAIARFIISRDRGNNVRSPDEYERIARLTFTNIRVDVRHDLLRLPYTHAILTCRRS